MAGRSSHPQQDDAQKRAELEDLARVVRHELAELRRERFLAQHTTSQHDEIVKDLLAKLHEQVEMESFELRDLRDQIRCVMSRVDSLELAMREVRQHSDDQERRFLLQELIHGNGNLNNSNNPDVVYENMDNLRMASSGYNCYQNLSSRASSSRVIPAGAFAPNPWVGGSNRMRLQHQTPPLVMANSLMESSTPGARSTSGLNLNNMTNSQSGQFYHNGRQDSLNNTVQSSLNNLALNNQGPPGVRANNYWDNFRSYSRQNMLSSPKLNTPVNVTCQAEARRGVSADFEPNNVHASTSNNTARPIVVNRNPVGNASKCQVRGEMGGFVENISSSKKRNKDQKLVPCKSNSASSIQIRSERCEPLNVPGTSSAVTFARLNGVSRNSSGDLTEINKELELEVSRFLRSNSENPCYVMELFQKLSLLETDFARHRALSALQGVLSDAIPPDCSHHFEPNGASSVALDRNPIPITRTSTSPSSSNSNTDSNSSREQCNGTVQHFDGNLDLTIPEGPNSQSVHSNGRSGPKVAMRDAENSGNFTHLDKSKCGGVSSTSIPPVHHALEFSTHESHSQAAGGPGNQARDRREIFSESQDSDDDEEIHDILLCTEETTNENQHPDPTSDAAPDQAEDEPSSNV